MNVNGTLTYDAPDLRMTWTIREAQELWQGLRARLDEAPAGSVLAEEIVLQRNKLEIAGEAQWGRGWFEAVL